MRPRLKALKAHQTAKFYKALLGGDLSGGAGANTRAEKMLSWQTCSDDNDDEPGSANDVQDALSQGMLCEGSAAALCVCCAVGWEWPGVWNEYNQTTR